MKNPFNKTKVITFTRTFILLFLTFAVLIFPLESFEGGKQGFILWTTILFPSLLPFFVLSDLLIQYGIIRFLGAFLEPIVSPLFKVRGIGGIIFLFSMVSGFPNGARMTAALFRQGILTKDEADRICAFSNFSNPIFIVGAVSIGMFNSLQLGYVLLAVHIVSNILVGITLGFGQETPTDKGDFRGTLQKEWKNWMTVSDQEVTFGARFTDAVKNSVQTLLVIGGLVIVFSVLNQLLHVTYITPTISKTLTFLFPFMDSIYIEKIITGLLEVTNGLNGLSALSSTPLLLTVLFAALLLGFNGFSVHAQVLSILVTEKISYGKFFYARILQAIYSAILVFVCYKPWIEPYLLKEHIKSSVLLVEPTLSATLFSPILLYLFTFTVVLLYLTSQLKGIFRK